MRGSLVCNLSVVVTPTFCLPAPAPPIATGNAPVNDTNFQYDVMMQLAQERAKAVNATIPSSTSSQTPSTSSPPRPLPSPSHLSLSPSPLAPSPPLSPDIYLIDLSLSVDEKGQEAKFFSANPSLGEWMWWPLGLAGLVGPPSAFSEADRRRMAAFNGSVWDVDKLPTRVELLRQVLSKPGPADPRTGQPRPMMVYVHCTAGCDRTGEMIAAYRLSYVDHRDSGAIQRVFGPNVAECGRVPNYYSVSATEWFCVFYSYAHGDANVGNCLHVADCAFLGDCTWPPKPDGSRAAQLPLFSAAEMGEVARAVKPFFREE